MSYTYPAGQPQGMPRRITNLLREMLIGEIIAINGYQTHIANSLIEPLNQVWHAIMLDEKEHYGLLTQLIDKYDPVQREQSLKFLSTEPPISLESQSYRPQYDAQILTNNLRSDIKGECEAIILYEQDLNTIPYQDIRSTVQYIVNDEKEHVAMLNQALLRMDRDPYGPINRPRNES